MESIGARAAQVLEALQGRFGGEVRDNDEDDSYELIARVGPRALRIQIDHSWGTLTAQVRLSNALGELYIQHEADASPESDEEDEARLMLAKGTFLQDEPEEVERMSGVMEKLPPELLFEALELMQSPGAELYAQDDLLELELLDGVDDLGDPIGAAHAAAELALKLAAAFEFQAPSPAWAREPIPGGPEQLRPISEEWELESFWDWEDDRRLDFAERALQEVSRRLGGSLHRKPDGEGFELRLAWAGRPACIHVDESCGVWLQEELESLRGPLDVFFDPEPGEDDDEDDESVALVPGVRLQGEPEETEAMASLLRSLPAGFEDDLVWFVRNHADRIEARPGLLDIDLRCGLHELSEPQTALITALRFAHRLVAALA